MDEKKRKSSRSFDLEKGRKRSFDLDKMSARKFDLAKDSDEISLEELKKDLLADGKIDAEEVEKLHDVLYADGKIDQEEADFVFELNDAVSGKKNDPTWNQFFVQVISDYLLKDEKSPGVIDEEEGKWLVEKIGSDGKVDGVEKQLLDHLKKNAKKMPAAVSALVTSAVAANTITFDQTDLQQLKKDILADGTIDKEEVKQLRKVLYADGKIDQEEADFVFELNDAVSGKKNDPTWNQFFVQVISDYLLNDEKSPGVIDDEEGKWLVEKIGADGQVDGVEKQLLNHLKQKAKKMPTVVSALITNEEAANTISFDQTDLQQLKKDILEDGMIDKEEVKQLRKVLYADGKIDQEEADFVFELNDAVSGKKNDPTWNQFFVQVISDYLLKDEKSPGVIDEEEGKWLVEKIGADGQVDGVEKQLLNHLKKNAKKMPASVEALLGGSTTPPASSVPTGESSSNDSGETNSKKWLWIILAIIIAAALTYFCVKSCNVDKEEQLTEQTTEDVLGDNGEQSSVNDSTANETASQESSVDDSEISDAGSSQTNKISEDAKKSNSFNSDVTSSHQESAAIQNNNGDSQKSSAVSGVSTHTEKSSAPVQSEPVTSHSKQVATNGCVDEIALDVIRGIYGNGQERKQKLGDRYVEIQGKVNEMYRNGLVH